MNDLSWSDKAEEIFNNVISNLPQFHRSIAEKLVKESAQELAKEKGKESVEEIDLIEAFFKEVPPAFKEMMKRLFNKLGVDYSQFVNE